MRTLLRPCLGSGLETKISASRYLSLPALLFSYQTLQSEFGAFMTPDEFRQDLEDYISYTRKSEVARGFDRVIIPGDLEFAQEQKSRDEGIPIPDEIWSQITDVARALNVSLN